MKHPLIKGIAFSALVIMFTVGDLINEAVHRIRVKALGIEDDPYGLLAYEKKVKEGK